jgi:histidinol-phosphate aminotransferase
MPQFNPWVDALEAYTPGEQPAPGSQVIKLNTNENPYPPSPKAHAAILAELDAGRGQGDFLRFYPDPTAKALRQAAADVYGFPLENILHGNGSDELLALIVRAFLREKTSAAWPVPTYSLYETLVAAQGAQVETYPAGSSNKLPTKLKDSRAKVIFIARPNAPLGNAWPLEEVKALALFMPRTLIAIDEAYASFSADHALDLARELPNVVVLRTLSKSHGLAGQRLGLLFGQKRIVAGLAKVKDSYNLDRLALAAGAAALRDEAYTAEITKKVMATRERLTHALAELGWQVHPSAANFVFARTTSAGRAAGAYAWLKERKILVRYFKRDGLDNGLRISVGTDPEIDALLAALATAPKEF